MKNLKDNKDGSCNCRMIDKNSCFFTDINGNRCDCKCHNSTLSLKDGGSDVESRNR